MQYWVLKIASPEGGAYVSDVSRSGPQAFEYRKGISLIDRCEVDNPPSMFFDPDYPEDTELFDFVDNINGLLMCNSKVKSLIESIDVENVEFIPVWLRDHNDEVASKDYFIVNPLDKVEIIDLEKSDVRFGRIIKDQINGIKNLVVDYERIPDNAKIFRATKKLDEIFVSDEIKKAFEEAKIVGCEFYEADGWNGLGV